MEHLTKLATILLLVALFCRVSCVATRKSISSTIRSNSTGRLSAELDVSQTKENGMTPKLPSTSTKSVHRLVGGHIHHSVYREAEGFFPKYQNRLSKPHLQKKIVLTRNIEATTPKEHANINFNLVAASVQTLAESPISESTTKESVFIVKAQGSEGDLKPESFGKLGAGDGVKEIHERKKDESKKTLSDQVADGKYGMIQNELFNSTPERPGILSYLTNSETPNDTVDNLGGLNQKDIWLAEDHLLVLKGGSPNTLGKDEPWKPIDDFKASDRPVKIPENPPIPPPFPVQLEENGPIELIRNDHFSRPVINPFINGSLILFPDGGFPKTESLEDNKVYHYGRPSLKVDNRTQTTNLLKLHHNLATTVPIINTEGFPFPINFHMPMPALPIYNISASFENSNTTDSFDEDDPSLFYPPPYSFVYDSNYSNVVQPGPLVPGIVLPPPPNFFGKLLEKTHITTANPVITSLAYESYNRRPNKTASNTTQFTHISTEATVKKTLKDIEVKSRQPPVLGHDILKDVDEKDVLRFGPKEALTNSLHSKNRGKPIYYEYFDARKPSVNNTPTAKDLKPSPPGSSNGSTTQSTEPTPRKPNNAYLPTIPRFGKQNFKSNLSHNSMSNNSHTGSVTKNQSYLPSIETAPVRTYSSEIENIRKTIEFFKHQHWNESVNQLVKSKAVSEKPFTLTTFKTREKYFHPGEFDSTPFKPMVKYSVPFDVENDFKAVAYTTVPTASSDLLAPTTVATTEPPLPSNLHFIPSFRTTQSKKSKLPILPLESYVFKPIPIKHNSYASITTQSPYTQVTVTPWMTIEKQILREVRPKQINVQIHSPSITSEDLSQSLNADNVFNGLREAIYKPVFELQPRPVVMTAQQNAYLRQIEIIRQQLQHNANYYTQKAENQSWPFGNYRMARPLKVPGTEYIPSNHFESHRIPEKHSSLFPSSHNSKFKQQYAQQVYHPLHRDVLVNYKYPLPAMEVEAEFLPPPYLLHPLPPAPLNFHRNGRLVPKSPSVTVRYGLPGDRNAGVFLSMSTGTGRK